MLEFRTQGYNGYSVKYSPFFDSRIAVASSANFGLVGNGRLYILGLTANGVATLYFTQDYRRSRSAAGCNGTILNPAIERGLAWMAAASFTSRRSSAS